MKPNEIKGTFIKIPKRYMKYLSELGDLELIAIFTIICDKLNDNEDPCRISLNELSKK